jgi:hypothetical protein
MTTRNDPVFPVTITESSPEKMIQKTVGGMTKREEAMLRLMSSHLENPNTKIEFVDTDQIADLVDRLFDALEKQK